MPYDRELITAAALAIIDAEGLEGLTMRRLGAHLGIDPMRIYRYFESRAELVEAIVAAELDRLRAIDFADVATDPVDFAVEYALRYWDVAHEHPNLAGVLLARPTPLDQRLAVVRVFSLVAQVLGIRDEYIPIFTEMIFGFALGFIVRDASLPFQHAQLGHDDAQYQAGAKRLLQENAVDTHIEQAMIDYHVRAEASREAFALGVRGLIEYMRTNPDAAMDPTATARRSRGGSA